MTIFAKKIVRASEFDAVQQAISNLQLTIGNAYDVMMMMVPQSNPPEVFVGLPDARFLAMFTGFKIIDRAELPDGMVSLVAREDGFQQSFPDIYGKCYRRRA